MSDDPAYILDVEGIGDGGSDSSLAEQQGRKWVGIHFECCGVYSRLYRNKDGTAYTGYCPRCSKPVRVRIGPGGTNHRMFRAC